MLKSKERYNKIALENENRIKQQKENEKQALIKFKKGGTYESTSYIIIYKDRMERYRIDEYNSFLDFSVSKNINIIDFEMVERLGYKEF